MNTSVISQKRGGRIQWIDLAKALGIILVCYGHLRNGDGESVWLPALDSSISFVYLFHMPLFFLLSGLTVSTRRNWRNFVITKAKTLLIPYYFYSLYFLAKPIAILIIPSLGETFRSSHPYSVAYQFYDVFVNGNGLWFLMALFWAELAVYGILKLTESSWIHAIVGIALIISYFAVTALFPSITVPFQLLRAVEVVGFMCLGFAVKPLLLRCNRTIASTGFVVLVVLLGVVGSLALSASSFNSVYACAAAIAGAFAVTFLSICIAHCSLLQYVGKNSLVYYAVNALTLNIVKFGAFKVIRIPGTELAVALQFVLGLLLTVVAMVILTGFNRFISRYLPWTLGRW